MQLPGGKVEMMYAKPERRWQHQVLKDADAYYGPYTGGSLGAERGPSGGFVPSSPAMQQAYRFAEENTPSVLHAIDRRSYGVQQAHLRGLRGRNAQTVHGSEHSEDPAGKYSGMLATLRAIHKEQAQQALAGQAEEAQISSMVDPTVLANEVMRQGAASLEARLKAQKVQAAAALQARKAAKVAELTSKTHKALKAVESSILEGTRGAKLESPARMMQLAEQPAEVAAPALADMPVSPGEGGKIQLAMPPVPTGGNGCAGSVLCSIPSNNVAIQALEARLQADEIAISTLTRDVQDLRQQTVELQKPLPLPPGTKAARGA